MVFYSALAVLSRGSSVVERRTENPCVASSILALGTMNHSLRSGSWHAVHFFRSRWQAREFVQKTTPILYTTWARGEMADTQDLKSCSFGSVGSSPTEPTTQVVFFL